MRGGESHAPAKWPLQDNLIRDHASGSLSEIRPRIHGASPQFTRPRRTRAIWVLVMARAMLRRAVASPGAALITARRGAYSLSSRRHEAESRWQALSGTPASRPRHTEAKTLVSLIPSPLGTYARLLRLLSGAVWKESGPMSPNPNCPSCGRTMSLERVVAPYQVDDEHVFGCQFCKLTYMTEDHTPISGNPVKA